MDGFIDQDWSLSIFLARYHSEELSWRSEEDLELENLSRGLNITSSFEYVLSTSRSKNDRGSKGNESLAIAQTFNTLGSGHS
jgi:hypothetical protein